MTGKKPPPKTSKVDENERNAESARKKPPVSLPSIPALKRPLPREK